MPAKTCQDRHPHLGTRCAKRTERKLAHVDSAGKRWTYATTEEGK